MVPQLAAILLPIIGILYRKCWKSYPDICFHWQRVVYRATGIIFTCAALYHTVGAVSVPVPLPDLFLFNEASAGYHWFFAGLNIVLAYGLFVVEPPSPFLAQAMTVLAFEQVIDHGVRAYRIEARGDAPDWASLPIIVLLPILADYMRNHLTNAKETHSK